MPITLGQNIASLAMQRRLRQNADGLGRAMERLSSGMRINHASDDAAGLAIATSLRADTRISAQAIRNVNDGLSMISIATAALQSINDIIARQLELATQAANGSYSVKQRVAMDREANALVDEFNRITSSVSFNGINPLTSDVAIQAGKGAAAVLNISAGSLLADEVGIGVFDSGTDLTTGSSVSRAVDVADIDGDGDMDIILAQWTDNSVAIMLSNGDGSFAAARTMTTGGNASKITVADLNKDGKLDIVTRGVNGTNAVAVFLGNGDGYFNAAQYYSVGTTVFFDFTLADFNGDGNLDFIGGHGQPGIGNGLALYLGNADGSFGSFRAIGTYRGDSFATGDFDGDGKMDLVFGDTLSARTRIFFGNGDGTFTDSAMTFYSGVETTDVNHDGYVDLMRLSSATTMQVLYGSASRTFTVGETYNLGTTTGQASYQVDINEDGYEDFVGLGTTTASLLINQGDGTFGTPITFSVIGTVTDVAAGDLAGDGSTDLIFASYGSNPPLRMFTQTGVTRVNQPHVNLLSVTGAREAMSALEAQSELVTQQIGQLGAQEARLQVAANVLIAQREAYISAEARIMDADVAAESAEMIRRNILINATTALLAQVNQNSQLVLKLLGDD